MKKYLSLLTVLSLVLLLAADDKPIARVADLPKPDADGFITIFNGKDLTGWQGLEEYWSVKDGVISGTKPRTHPNRLSWCWTGAKPGDFELHLKYKFATQGWQLRHPIPLEDSRREDVSRWRLPGRLRRQCRL